MRIKILVTPPGRQHLKVGEVMEFKGPVEEGYAKKYVARGWAEEVTGETVKPAPASTGGTSPKYAIGVTIPLDWAKAKPADMVNLAKALGAKPKNQAEAANAITEALFERGETAVFQTVIDGDKRFVYVSKQWPAILILDRDVSKLDPEAVSMKDGEVTFKVANGMALYQIAAEDKTRVVAVLADSTFEPPPAPEAK